MRRRKQLALNGQAPTPLIMCNWKWRTVGHTIYGDMPRCNRNPSPDELAVFGCCGVAQLPKLLRLFGLPFFVVPPPHGSWFHLLLGSNFIFIKNNTVQFLFIEIGSHKRQFHQFQLLWLRITPSSRWLPSLVHVLSSDQMFNIFFHPLDQHPLVWSYFIFSWSWSLDTKAYNIPSPLWLSGKLNPWYLRATTMGFL